ncbi:ROK family transcriptional regulator [Effusibacillus lacus]|uniref:Transcriptional regulator n=1 Tax=Effusibacillus lacus TaxID=1348429 RepID=A0A292YP93_9BACL|nr:ROK family transcriptional regulator [Effusibacillus lacus]TCS71086.1 putative NBD/HSP70 family sugar kinase [Effusibacillus lacus]GAX90729.1 transcriptional regulator [Effusibacillus lacus]
MQDRRPRGNVQLMKQLNREAILQHIREQGQISRAGLAELTALSKPSISALVDELLQEGWIREVGIGESSGGRRPILLELNSEGFAIVGAVFEGTGLEMAVSNLNGEVLGVQHVTIKTDASGQVVLDALEKEILTFLIREQVNLDQVLGIGIGLPGVTQRGNGTIHFSPSTGWNNWPIRQELERRLSTPVFLENDVNLMALGEFYKGAGQGTQHLVYIHIGTGIGAGIILNGQLYRGFSEASGEIGYQVIGNPIKRDKSEYGIFEGNYASAAILQRINSIPGLRGLGELFASDENAVRKLVDLAGEFPELREILEDAYTHWAYGIANVVCVLNPEVVILGGDIFHIGEAGLQRIREIVEQIVPVMPRLKFAELGERAGVIGAVFHVLEADRSLSGKLGGVSWK